VAPHVAFAVEHAEAQQFPVPVSPQTPEPQASLDAQGSPGGKPLLVVLPSVAVPAIEI
jgi:hypothetical protein